MVRFDSALLKGDPGLIVVGAGEDRSVALDQKTLQPETNGAACQAAILSYRTALMFRILFTSLVFAVGLAAAAALIYAIIKIMTSGIDLSSAITGVSGFVAGGASIYLGKRASESINVARNALEDVGKYCGTGVRNNLSK